MSHSGKRGTTVYRKKANSRKGKSKNGPLVVSPIHHVEKWLNRPDTYRNELQLLRKRMLRRTSGIRQLTTRRSEKIAEFIRVSQCHQDTYGRHLSVSWINHLINFLDKTDRYDLRCHEVFDWIKSTPRLIEMIDRAYDDLHAVVIEPQCRKNILHDGKGDDENGQESGLTTPSHRSSPCTATTMELTQPSHKDQLDFMLTDEEEEDDFPSRVSNTVNNICVHCGYLPHSAEVEQPVNLKCEAIRKGEKLLLDIQLLVLDLMKTVDVSFHGRMRVSSHPTKEICIYPG